MVAMLSPPNCGQIPFFPFRHVPGNSRLEISLHLPIGKMKLLSQVCLSTALLLSQCSAFSPVSSTSRQTTVVQNTIRSPWTMMPDEPTPEVCGFHVFHGILGCFRPYNCFCLPLRCNFRLIPVARTLMSNPHLILFECPSSIPKRVRWM